METEKSCNSICVKFPFVNIKKICCISQNLLNLFLSYVFCYEQHIRKLKVCYAKFEALILCFKNRFEKLIPFC